MSTFPEQRDCVLHKLHEELLAHEDEHHLHRQLHEAAAGGTLLLVTDRSIHHISLSSVYTCLPVPKQSVVVIRGAGKAALDEGNVEDGAVEVDKLEEVTLQGQGVVIVSLGPAMLKVNILHIKSLPEEPHLTCVGATFSDFRHLS